MAARVLALTLLGAALQGLAIDDKSLWGDEIVSLANASGHAWYPDEEELELVLPADHDRVKLRPEPDYFGQHLEPALDRDSQGPLYYALLTLFLKVLGTSEAGVRALSVLASLLTIPLVFAIGRRLRSADVGLLAAALYALAPFEIAYGTFARPYALLGLIGTASVLLALRLAGAGAPESEPAPRWPAILGWCAVAAAGLYTHYLYVFVLGFCFLLVAWQRRREPRTLARWIAAQALVALAFLPWLPHFLEQARWNATGPLTWSYWYAKPLSPLGAVKYAGRDVAQFLSAARIEELPGAGVLTALSYGGAVLLVLLTAARLGPALFARGAGERRAGAPAGDGLLGRTCLAWSVCVFGGALVLDLVKGSHSIDSPRYFVCAAPPVYLAVAGAVRGLPGAALRRAATFGTVAFLSACCALYLSDHAHKLRYEQDMRGAARAIDASGGDEDLILLLSPGPNPMDLTYYLEASPDFGRACVPERWKGIPLPALDVQLAERTAGRARVWFIDDHGPEVEGMAAVLAWLRARYGEPETTEVRNLELYRFERGG